MRLRSLLCATALATVAVASSGDRAPDFQKCVNKCQRMTCSTYNPTLALRLTRWSCTDDCRYMCMHTLTDYALESGQGVQQYYGKWPFYRFAGMQEPASVVFSLTNLLLHVWGLDEVRREVPTGHPMKQFYVRWAYISCNAWLWSSVFHTRDTSLTEKFDYFSAGLTILYSLYFSVVRLFHLYPVTPRARAPIMFYLWSLACAVAYAGHVAYLTLRPRFDYSYNIAANVALGLAHNALWLVFALPARLSVFRRFRARDRTYRPWYATRAATAVALTTAATCLELFDFPPWMRTVDAHALWHLATAPLAVLWYDFLINDAMDPGWRAMRMR
ncbi:Per1-like protein [Vararia minispora EC-137]|uniref:Per1-like protein n=1 Tax=Vararia minispora EC-137 TaxID=1314806 RepID=A0ACB8QTL4_9AGAM|nr:Per1-like protein [Vararia minispora EC-137]